jgi:hypothetical protein
LTLISLAIGYAQGGWNMGNLIDLIVICCGGLLILDAGISVRTWKKTLWIFVGFSVFYALSVWFHKFFPDLYAVYLGMLKNGNNDHLKSLTSYYTGFTTNPGHTAGYMAIGVFCCISAFTKKKWIPIILAVFLLYTITYTGLRMQMLATCVAVAAAFIMRTAAKKRIRILLYLCAAGVGCVAIVLLLREQLSAIPVFNRIYSTIDGLLSGKDVSSNRSNLYRHAWELFKTKPIFGIGWGNYRLTVLGVVTKKTQYDVHNIYLQLLTETGIVGCVCFLVPVFYTLVETFRLYNRLLHKETNAAWAVVTGFSLMYQVYFLTVGLTDNTLYNIYSLLPYLLSCLMVFSCMRLSKAKGIAK